MEAQAIGSCSKLKKQSPWPKHGQRHPENHTRALAATGRAVVATPSGSCYQKISTGGQNLGQLDKTGSQPFDPCHQRQRIKRPDPHPGSTLTDQQKNRQQNPEYLVDSNGMVELNKE